MPIPASVLAVLQEDGYRPQGGPGGVISFRYYGQAASTRIRPLGSAAIVELECPLPRPAPAADVAEAFAQRNPLAGVSGQGGQALLRITTMVSEGDTAAQVRTLLSLLDTYAADFVFSGEGLPEWTEPEVKEEGVPSAPPAPEASPPVPAPQPAPVPVPAPPVTPPPAPLNSDIPAGWEGIWTLLSDRFHPLARALAALKVPVPDEVQMDMMQGRQVRGTAIMMWGSPPDAVVVCEQGQHVPEGYRGGMWLRHQTVDQVALETRAYLQSVGRA